MGDIIFSKKNKWILGFAPLSTQKVLESVLETEAWLDAHRIEQESYLFWDRLPGKELAENALLLKDTGMYGGSAGIALFYLRLYQATKNQSYLEKVEKSVDYFISKYKGIADFYSEEPYLKGAYIGYFNGPAGGAYVASYLYEATGDEKYKQFAKQVAEDLILAGHEEAEGFTWYGDYSILSEGSLILFLIDFYEKYGEEAYLQTAYKAAKYIVSKKEKSPWGGYRWYAMPTDTFPTIGKAGGYFPGFEYGAAGSGYILATVYQYVKDEKLLEVAKGAAEYIQNVADYSEDGEAALVRYNDTYLTDLYYLGICQGPVGTSRLFYRLYDLTGEEQYQKFVVQLTNGLLASGAPFIHSAGYWRTNCYCCGAAGMLEHFINVYKLTGDEKYKKAANAAAESVLGESTVKGVYRNWYTSWNRHEPDTSDAYTGLYHGTAGNASALLAYYEFLKEEKYHPPYLEDPYKKL